MQISTFTILFLVCFSAVVTDANSGIDLKKEVDTLKAQVATSNLMLAQIYKEFSSLKAETIQSKASLVQLNQKISSMTQFGICQIMQNAPCGDCRCVEDLTLVQKYFCDCRARPVERDCKEHYLQGQRFNGLYLVDYNLGNRYISQVFCDQTTDGGGWTVVQRRMDGSENFFRNWTEYRIGFGELHKEHWLGNEQIYFLTSHAFLKGSELRVDMQIKAESTMRWAKYSGFNVDAEHTGYTLHISGFSGSYGVVDRLVEQNNMKFSTYDVDNDHWSYSCSLGKYGAWWYNDCHRTNLNARYNEFQSYDWTKSFSWQPHILQFSEMKVRRQ